MSDGLTIGIEDGWRMFRQCAVRLGFHEGDEAFELAMRAVFFNGCGHVLNLIAREVNEDGTNIVDVHAKLFDELRALTFEYRQVQGPWPG